MDDFHGMKVLASCGRGGFGEVLYCEEISGRRVAVKIVSRNTLGGEWERELQGVRNYSRITDDAPELLKIFHVEEDEECFWYTMEPADSADPEKYIPDTLAARLAAGPLPPEQLFPVLFGIFRGVRAIHEAGFAHRDIKPENVIFVKGKPKLADIGLFSSLTVTMTRLAGSFEFIPPEVRSGKSAGSSDRASRCRNDLYAFGKVVYCAVTGNDPREFPSIPPELNTSLLPVKLFMRLAFQLCENQSWLRLDSIAAVQRRLEEIRDKLDRGESLGDRIAYHFWLQLSRFRSLKLHYVLLAIVLVPALIGGLISFVGSWHREPELLYDLNKSPTQKYKNRKVGIELPLPARWQVMTPAQVREKCGELRKNPDLPGFEAERISLLGELAGYNRECEYIFPAFEKAPFDHIAVSPIRFSAGSPDKISDRELREKLKELFPPRIRAFSSTDGEIKREKIGRFQTIAVSGSIAGGEHRIPDQCFFRVCQNARGFFVFVQVYALGAGNNIEAGEYLYQGLENMKNL
ncbi:MAG: protein kinase [Lentisphaeria bacterium]|nr:protein kinase [Lentisphaeria bacterium]